MEEDNVFKSTIWRFGSWFYPQLIEVTKNGIEYTKLKLINYIGVPIDVTTIDKKFINGVYLSSHLFSGTDVTIENISGSNIVLRNFKRKDAESIQELILA